MKQLSASLMSETPEAGHFCMRRFLLVCWARAPRQLFDINKQKMT